MIGERIATAPFALAGAIVLAADDPGAVRAAWDGLPGGVAVVVLTQAAAAVLGEEIVRGGAALVVTMP